MPSVRSVLLSSRSEHPRLCLAQHTGTHSVLLAHCCVPSAGQRACEAASIAAESSPEKATCAVPRVQNKGTVSSCRPILSLPYLTTG